MRILHHINFVTSTGADRFIGEGYKDAFEDLGHAWFWLTSADDVSAKIQEVHPDLVFIGWNRLALKDVPMLQNFRKKGGKVAITVASVFDPASEYFRVLKEYDIADLCYGETEPEWMKDFKQWATGRHSYLYAERSASADPFPVAPVKKICMRYCISGGEVFP